MFWILLVIVFILLGIILFMGLAGHLFYELVLNARYDKEIFTGPYIMDARAQKNEAQFRKWDPRDIFMVNKEGLKLHAIVAGDNPDKWVIIVHGYMGRNAEMVDAANQFLSAGYSILMPSHRGHARSEGNQVTMGIHESQDLVQWVQYLTSKYPKAKIYMLGVSMGAASVMMASTQNLPENVKAIAEDCGYTSAMDEFAWQLKKMFKMPRFPFIQAADYVTRIRGKLHLRQASPIEAIQETDIPILFIHGDADTFVPTHMVYKLYNYANYPKELLIIKGGDHAVARFKDPETYYKTVLAWFDRFQ